jgi:hypothetical protein
MIEADPRGRHRIGVDVVEEILGADIAHRQLLPGELATDEIGILRQVEDALAGGQRETAVHRACLPPIGTSARDTLRRGRGLWRSA